MGKTVPSYRMAIEWEMQTWKRFRASLPSDEERAAFDQLMDYCRVQSMAAQNACKPILFEPMVMSMILEQGKVLRKLEVELAALRKQKALV